MLHLKFPNRCNARCEPSALHWLKADPFTVNELVSVGFLTNYCTVNLGPVFIYPYVILNGLHSMQRPCWAVLSSQPALGHASRAWQTDTDAEGSLWTGLSCIEWGHPLCAHQGTVTGTPLPSLSFHLSIFCFSKKTGEHCTLLKLHGHESMSGPTRE